MPCAKILETARARAGRHHRAERAHHPVARGDGLRGQRDGARGVHHSAPHRRRHHLAGRTPPSRSSRTTSGPTVHVLDASRAVGVAGNLLSDTLRDDFVAGHPRGVSRRARAAEPATSRRSGGSRSRTPGGTGWPSTGAASSRRCPAPPASRVLDDYPLDDLVAADRLDAVLPDLGAGRATIPAILDRPDASARRRPASSATRRPCSTGSSGSGCSRRAACSASSAPTRWATTSSSTPTRTRDRARCAVIHTLRQQMPKPPGRPNLALADFVAPRETGCRRLRRRLRGDDRARARRARGGVRGRARRLQRDPRQGAGRPAGRGVRRAAARAGAPGVLGLRARRGARQRRPDPRAVPGHPAGAGLPGLPRPHREAHAVRPAAGRGQRGHHADRELRHAADRRR